MHGTLTSLDDIWMYVNKKSIEQGYPHSRYPGAGAAYGTAKSGIGIAGVGTFRPDLIMKVGTHRAKLVKDPTDP